MPPRFTTAVGGDVTFRCQESTSARGQVNGALHGAVQWKRADGRSLSSRATVDGNTLMLQRVESTDEGRYICVVSSQYGQSNAEAELTVSGNISYWLIIIVHLCRVKPVWIE